MKIAFDAQPLLSGTKSGVGFCEDGLVAALLELYPENEYMLEYFSLRNHDVKKEKLSKYTQKKAMLSSCRWFPGSLYRMASAYVPIPYRLLFPKKKQVTHFFNYYIPPFVRGKKVVTIHDMTLHIYPETMRKKTLWFLKKVLKASIRRADHIVTDSAFSKQEMMKFYNIPEDKISVVLCGVDFERFHPLENRERLEVIKQKYNIKKEYFLYLGTLEPRKNLVRFVQAYAKAKNEKRNFPSLVLAGGKGWMYEEIFSVVQELGLEKDVIFTGYVQDDEVATLMGGAMAFCFPSLYEGFGMPVIEAMACGTPVLTSRHSSMEEIAGEESVLVDALSVDSIKEGLIRLYESEELREELSQRGLAKAKQYTWEVAGKQLIQVYQDLVKD